MIGGDELVLLFLANPGERPLLGTLKNLLYGIAIGLILTLINHWLGVSRLDDVFGYLFVGWGLSFFGWGAERLWYSTVATMIKHPFAWYAYITRLPFWYIAGGIGYTFCLLIAKKVDLLSVNEIPIKLYFMFGGKMEVLIQVVFQIRVHHFLKKISSENYIFKNQTR